MYTLFDYQQKIRDRMDDYFSHPVAQGGPIRAPARMTKLLSCGLDKSVNEGKPIYL